METPQLLEVAKQILDFNPYACLTGTLMLKVRGIYLGREPADIDILIRDYAPNIKFPEQFGKMEPSGYASDGSGAKYIYKGIIIDVLSDGEEPEIINGVKCGTMAGLMQNKYKYSTQGNSSANKHYEDLVKLGFEFPTATNVIDLPF